MNITLITVVGGYAGILPHMLAHYKSLGVNEILIHAHGLTRDDEILSEIEHAASEAGATIASVHTGPWFAAMNQALYMLSRSTRPGDWFVLADQDELQAYPDGLVDVIEFCDRKGYTFVEGCIIDRLAKDGTLPKVSSDRPVWEQFPLGALVSGRLLHSVINKVVAVRGSVMLSEGQHHASSGVGCPVSSMYVPVHHFKWVDALLPQLKARVAFNQEFLGARAAMDLYGKECKRFLEHYERHGGIDVSDPSLMAAPCDPLYPFWNKLKEWRSMAGAFSAELALRTQLHGGSE